MTVTILVSRPRKSDADAFTVFNLGDTDLVKTASRVPSVAVITALWTVEGDNFRPKAALRLRVHWFVRPGELPKIRARREFDEVRASPLATHSCERSEPFYGKDEVQRDHGATIFVCGVRAGHGEPHLRDPNRSHFIYPRPSLYLLAAHSICWMPIERLDVSSERLL